jgi:replicative DNA helicase
MAGKTENAEQIVSFLTAAYAATDCVVYDPLIAEERIWFSPADDLEEITAEILEGNNNRNRNAYFGVNCRKPNQTGAAGTAYAVMYFADFDGVEPAQAESQIFEAGLPVASAVVMSGTGTHAYWFLIEQEHNLDEWEHRQEWIATAVSSDPAVCDRQRLSRLPGTLNNKPKYKHDPPRSELLRCVKDCRYSWHELQPNCDPPTTPEPKEPMPKRERGNGEVLPGDDFMNRTKWEELLPPGWRPVGKVRNGLQAWTHGIDGSRNKSATVRIGDETHPPAIYVWSTTQKTLPTNQWHTMFYVYAKTHHNGDMTAAAKQLAEDGYGKRPETDLSFITAERTEMLEQPEPTPYPTDAFPEDIKNFIEQSATSICCEPVMIANPLLSALSTVAGGINNIEIKAGWVEPLILWTMVVADSGSKKSPAFKAALAPLEAIESELEEENLERKKDNKIAQRVYESELAIWKSKMRDASKLKKGQAVTPFKEAPPIEPDDYMDKSVICTDVTIESLGKILNFNKNGVLLAVDEASSWIDGFDRYGGSGEVGKWLSLHSGSRMRADRVGRGRNFVVDPRLCVAGGIQPWVLAEVIGKQHVANGLFQRFLVAQPKKVRRRFDTPSVDPLTSAVITAVFDDMRWQAMNQEGFNLLRLSPEAVDVYRDFYDRHANKQHATDGAEAGMLAKIEAESARLAGVLYTVKVMLHRTDGFGDVDGESMTGGIALAEWYVAEWERLYRGELSAEPDPDDVLLDYLVKHGGRVKRTKIMQGVRRYRSSDVLDQALFKLVSQGVVKVETESHLSGAGRPSEWISLVE